eukprot:13154465-Heterocapsa_arctica.AAC.1
MGARDVFRGTPTIELLAATGGAASACQGSRPPPGCAGGALAVMPVLPRWIRCLSSASLRCRSRCRS